MKNDQTKRIMLALTPDDEVPRCRATQSLAGYLDLDMKD